MNLKDKDSQEKKLNLNYLLISLVDVQLKYKNLFVHSFMEPLKDLYMLLKDFLYKWISVKIRIDL